MVESCFKLTAKEELGQVDKKCEYNSEKETQLIIVVAIEE